LKGTDILARKKKEVPAVVAPVPTTASAPLDDLVTFVEKLVETGGDVDLRECFLTAVDIAAYVKAVHEKTMVQASRYVPETIRAVGDKAVKGDLDAAKLLFDYLGLRVKQPLAQVATQVNINVPTLKDIVEFGEDNVVDGALINDGR